MNNTLPSSTRKPGVYAGFDTSRGSANLPANAWRALIIAQRLEAGTVAGLVPTPVFSAPAAAGFFGAGSPAHLMAAIAIANNSQLDLTVITVDDAPESTKATGSITIGGTATGSGTSTLMVGNVKFDVGTSTDDDATATAAALIEVMGTVPGLPVTYSQDGSTINFTAKNAGTIGNSILLSFESDASGITLANLVDMNGGAVDPDLTELLDAVFATRYHCIITQFADPDNLLRQKTNVDTVSGKIEQRGERFYYSAGLALASVTTLASGVNFERSGTPYFRGTPSLPCEVAAAFGGYRCSVSDPSLSLDGDELVGLGLPAVADRLSRTEQEMCLHNGVTPIEVGPDGSVQIVRAITNYVVDSHGIADDTLLDDTTIATLDYVRDVVRAIARPKKATPRTAASYRDLIYARLKQLSAPSVEILLPIDDYKADLIVEANPSDRPAGWFRVAIPAPVVPGLHVLDETIVLYI